MLVKRVYNKNKNYQVQIKVIDSRLAKVEIKTSNPTFL